MKKRFLATICAISLILSNIPFKAQATSGNMYQAYYDVLMGIVSEYGYKELVLEDSNTNDTGLCFAKMLDFDIDGEKELCVGYVNRNNYVLEVWGFNGDSIECLHEESYYLGGYTGYNQLYVLEDDAKKAFHYNMEWSFGVTSGEYYMMWLKEIGYTENNMIEEVYINQAKLANPSRELEASPQKYDHKGNLEGSIDSTNLDHVELAEKVENTFFETYGSTNIYPLITKSIEGKSQLLLDTSLISELEAKLPYQTPVKKDVSTYLPYVGDYSKLNMSTKQAEATIELIKESEIEASNDGDYGSYYEGNHTTGFTDHSGYKYVLFDSGNGVPAILQPKYLHVWNGNNYEKIELLWVHDIFIYKDTTVFKTSTWSNEAGGGSRYNIYDLQDTSKVSEYTKIDLLYLEVTEEDIQDYFQQMRKSSCIVDLNHIYHQNDYGYSDGIAYYNYGKNAHITFLNGKSIHYSEIPSYSSDNTDYYIKLFLGEVEVTYDDNFVSANTLITALNTYIDESDDYFSYQNLTNSQDIIDEVKTDSNIVGEVTAFYKISDGIYYMICGDVGYVIKIITRDGEQEYSLVEQTSSSLTGEELQKYVTEYNTKCNININYSDILNLKTESDCINYLNQILNNYDGIELNDTSKQELSTFIEMLVTNNAIFNQNSNNNAIIIDSEEVTKSLELAESLEKTLAEQLANTTLNKNLSINLKCNILGLDINTPIQVTLDDTLCDVLSNQNLQLILSDNQYMIEVNGANLKEILKDYSKIIIQIELLEDGSYTINFVDENGNIIEKLPASLGFTLPAISELATLIMTSGVYNENWGGQFDNTTNTLKFNTSISGGYMVTEQVIDIFDLDEYTEEEQQIIKFMISKGFFELDENNNFSPETKLSRYEFTQAIVSMFFALDREITTSFPDVLEDSHYYSYVASAEKDSLIQGYEDGEFKGDNEVSIQELLAIIARALVNQKDYMYPTEYEEYFANVNLQTLPHEWANELVALCIREGIVEYNETLSALDGANRVQSAIYLYRLFMLLNETGTNITLIPTDFSDIGDVNTETNTEVNTSSSNHILPVIGVSTLAVLGGATAFIIKKRKVG